MEFVIPIKIPIIKNGVQIYEEKIYIPSNKLVITFEDKKIINIAKFLFFHGYEHLIDENCNKKMKGNDGSMYISNPNKNNICSWKKI